MQRRIVRMERLEVQPSREEIGVGVCHGERSDRKNEDVVVWYLATSYTNI